MKQGEELTPEQRLDAVAALFVRAHLRLLVKQSEARKTRAEARP